MGQFDHEVLLERLALRLGPTLEADVDIVGEIASTSTFGMLAIMISTSARQRNRTSSSHVLSMSTAQSWMDVSGR